VYRESFRGFQELFRTTKQDVSRLQLASILPPSVYMNPVSLDAVVTAGLLAMLDSRWRKLNVPSVALRDVQTYFRFVVPTAMPEAADDLDEIILKQTAITGMGLIFSSDLVKSRVHDWERRDYRKYKRLLAALDKASRIHQRRTPANLKGVPFLREAKKQAVAELQPVLNRLQEKFKAERRSTTADGILKAFAEEASKPELNFLGNPHNLKLWIDFLSMDPFSLVTRSAAELFDRFAAFVSGHVPDYTRREYSKNN
jgi:hypothetical protein